MTPISSTPPGARAAIGHIAAVEALRGIAMLWVVLFHYLAVRDARAADPWVALLDRGPIRVLVRNGYLGVDLFFLVSGFLLVMPWVLSHRDGMAPPAALDFYARRARRILPAYYVQLAILFGVLLPLVHGVGFIRGEAGLVAYNAIAHVLLLQYTTPVSSASLSLNGALWTLTLEAQFYLLLPLLAPWFVRRPLLVGAALLLAAAAWRAAAQEGLDPLVAAMMASAARWDVQEGPVRHFVLTQLPGYLGHFAAGMTLGLAWLRSRAAGGTRLAAPVALALVAACVAFLYWLFAHGGVGALRPLGAWLATLAALTLFFHVAVSGALGPVLDNRPLRWAGRVSYSAYLYHVPLLLLLNRAGGLDASWLSLPAFALALGLVAAASHRWVELPWLRRAAGGPQGATGGATIITR